MHHPFKPQAMSVEQSDQQINAILDALIGAGAHAMHTTGGSLGHVVAAHADALACAIVAANHEDVFNYALERVGRSVARLRILQYRQLKHEVE
jgi:hypothetical protein